MMNASIKLGIRAKRAFTMVECVMSLVLVSGLMVVSLNTVGASTVSQSRTGDRAIGQLLAMELMTEILQQPYEDPTETTAFGLETLDGLSVTRIGFDDVDDYQNLSMLPQSKNGTTYAEYVGWTLTVAVTRVDLSNHSLTRTIETGVKKIEVTAKRGQITVASMVALKTKGPATASGTIVVVTPEMEY